ncbi:Na+/H+ antiporter [Leptospirillum ferriphilum]|nr:MAG: Na+/H+ antiporter [Leptospirillum sp. Group II '5-way CG']
MTPVSAAVWLLFLVVLVSSIGVKWRIPQPALLVLAGFFLSFSSPFHDFHLDSRTFFALFIPPLLFADAWLIPKRELRKNFYSVILLGFGLVFATVAATGFFVHWMIPAIPLASAFVLGAVLSPTDTVALNALISRISLPQRLVYVLAGESLINDASGLVSFKFALGAVLQGHFTWPGAIRDLFWVTAGGLLAGFVIAYNIHWFRQLLSHRGMENPTVQTSLSLVTPYFAYMAANSFGASGILSVVAAGLYAGISDVRDLSGSLRLHAASVWNMLTFVLEGFVFLLLGLQLRRVFSAISPIPVFHLVTYSLLVTAMIILVRILWVFPFSRISWMLNRIHARNLPPPSWKSVFLAGWIGVRGAVTLAAALAIPLEVHGKPFPGRDLIIFLSGSVILLSMSTVILTLEPLARWLNIKDPGESAEEEQMARLEANQKALAFLSARAADETLSEQQRDLLNRIASEYILRIRELEERKEGSDNVRKSLEEEISFRIQALQEEKRVLHRLREEHRIDDQTLRRILRDLDLVEEGIRSYHPR